MGMLFHHLQEQAALKDFVERNGETASQLDTVLTRKASEAQVSVKTLLTMEQCSSEHCKNPCCSQGCCPPFTIPTDPLAWKEVG
jgi:hypothetical protein